MVSVVVEMMMYCRLVWRPQDTVYVTLYLSLFLFLLFPSPSLINVIFHFHLRSRVIDCCVRGV